MKRALRSQALAPRKFRRITAITTSSHRPPRQRRTPFSPTPDNSYSPPAPRHTEGVSTDAAATAYGRNPPGAATAP